MIFLNKDQEQAADGSRFEPLTTDWFRHLYERGDRQLASKRGRAEQGRSRRNAGWHHTLGVAVAVLWLLTMGKAAAETETVPASVYYSDNAGHCGGPSYTTVESIVQCLLDIQIQNNHICRMTGVIIPHTPDVSYLQMDCYYNGFNNPPTTLDNSSYAAATAVCEPGYNKLFPDNTQVNAVCSITLIVNDQTEKDTCDLGVGNPIFPGSCRKVQTDVDYTGSALPNLTYRRTYISSTSFSGWRSNFDKRIVVSGNTATAHRPDRTLRFVRSGSQWYPDADVNYVLTGSSGSFSLRTPDSNDVETYDSYNRFYSLRSAQGVEKVRMTYSTSSTPTSIAPGSGYLISATTYFGMAMSFTYDAAGRRTTMVGPGGGTYTYTYDAVGNLETVTYPDGAVRTYVYNEAGFTAGANLPNKLTGIIDESGNRYASYGYDTEGRPVMSEHAGGVERVQVSYTSPPTIQSDSYIDVANKRKYVTRYIVPGVGTTVTDSLGNSRMYSFGVIHGASRVTSASAPCSRGCNFSAQQQSYDVNGNVSSRSDFNGLEARYTHDLARNLEISRTEAYGTNAARTTVTQWHSTYRLPIQIDSGDSRTTYTYDSKGNVVTFTRTDSSLLLSRTYSYSWTGLDQIASVNGPRTNISDVTNFIYWGGTSGGRSGQLRTVTNAKGHVTTYNTYNAHGQPLTITDPNGVVTTLTYDLRQRLTSRTVGSEVTTFEYWPTGLLKKATLPDGSYLFYTYDAAHRLTDIEDAEGNRIHYTLDAMGNRTAEESFDPSNALFTTRTRVFNTLNQLWKEIGAAGTVNVTTTFGYDNNGNQTAINAPLSRHASQSYDELNRLTSITDPESGLTQYGYNALDQLISVTDPRGKVTSYTYNALGDLTQQVSPDTGTTINTYDSAGNVSTKTDARSKTGTYSYDALNRVTQLSYPDQTIAYTYDSGTNQKGRLTGITDASGSTSWSYDSYGRVTSRQQTMGSLAKTVSYSYDSTGRLQTLTLPSGHAITYGYSNGQVASLTLNGSTTLLSNVLYQPFGPTTGWTWGNATLAVREYDADGLVTDIDSAGLKSYSYDDAFRLTSITDASDPTLTHSYGYDLLDRLTSASGTTLNQSWTYDANGNRLTQGGAQASTYTVSSTSNRLSAVTGSLTRTYSYDAAGNITSDGTATFMYDDAGRMVSATKAGTTTTYQLNALGQRVRKTTGAVSTYFAYDETGRLLGEYDNAGNLIQETIWFGDIPVAVLKPNGSGVDVFYIHADHLNAPRRISRPSDNVIVWRWDSDPFGTTAANEDPDGDSNLFVYNLRFPGQYYDDETGLHYNYHRDHDPTTGRYVQSDPLGLIDGPNTYAYVKNNPVGLSDPMGLAVQRCCRKARIAFGLVDHCWLKTNTTTAGMNATPQCSLPGENQSDLLWVTDVYVSDASCEMNGRCETIPDVDEQCVNRELAIGRSLGRFGFTNNCQTFAWTVLTKCSRTRYTPPEFSLRFLAR